MEKKIIVIFLIAIICVTAGCSEKAPPLPNVVSGTIEIPVVQSSYSWGKLGCVDYVGGKYMVKGRVPTILPYGADIKIFFNYKPQPSMIHISQYLYDKIIEVPLKNSRIKAPAKKGIYYYGISAFWVTDDGKYSNGNTSSVFAIEVK